MKGNIQIESLLDKPVWQMTGKEYLELTQYALKASGGLLRDAIVSRIGRRIVFDVERARELAKQGRER